MEKDRTLGLIDPAPAAAVRRFMRGALLLALAASFAACARSPRLGGPGGALAPEEHVRLGTAYEEQGLRAEAAGQYEAAVRSDPACAECWLALGNLAFTEGRLKEAGTCFRKAGKASPGHAGAANNLAMVILARNGSLPEAEALAQDALRNAGALKPYILDTLANIFLRERRYAEAEAAIDQAEAAAPPENGLMRAQLLETRKSITIAAAGQPRAAGPVR